jgi:hypothetical protein
MAISGPGADTRTWIALGRVLERDDAIRWDSELGWLVDLGLLGEDDGEEITARVAWSYLEAGGARVDPPPPGGVCVVVIPAGDLNLEPTIAGYLQTSDLTAPQSIQGEDVDAELARATHLLATSRALRWAIEGDVRISSEGTIYLAEPDATQSFVRGEDQRDALRDGFDAVDAVIQGLATAPVVSGGSPIGNVSLDPATLAQWAAALAQLRQALTDALSTRIRGE